MIEMYKEKLSKLLHTPVEIEVYVNNKWILFEKYHFFYIKNSTKGLEFRVLDKYENLTISYFTLIELPGCCGICISTGTQVYNKYRNKGVNTLLNNFRIDVAKQLGYDLLLCTDVSNNTHQLKTLDKNNWEHIYNFNNPRTGNNLNISIKNLTN